jgi:hypothetical protein
MRPATVRAYPAAAASLTDNSQRHRLPSSQHPSLSLDLGLTLQEQRRKQNRRHKVLQ